MKTKMPFEVATIYANEIITKLLPLCKRLAVAGSIRRCKPEIGDIELVAIPLPHLDMFNQETPDDHALNYYEWRGLGRIVKNGNKYKQIELYQGINLDLFIVTPPAQWGIQFLIRTGPADFSKRVVTQKKFGGLLPSNFRVQDGAIWSNNHMIETPEEIGVFNLIGVPFIEPEQRI